MPTATQHDVAAVVAAFQLTDAQVQEMARLIYERARVPTYTARYARAAQALKVTLPSDWQPGEAALRKMAQDALTSAKSIADTYHADLEAEARHLAAEEKSLHKSMLGGLADWARGRAPGKSTQIANYECSDAGDDGTFDCIADAYAGTITPGVNLDDMQIYCLPFQSTSDVCSAYAGLTFSLDEYEALRDVLPAHANCPHEFIIDLK